MVTIYGIRNCDTMKKAFTWLNEHGIEHDFHDYKKAGIDADTLRAWLKQIDRSVLVNTRGTTWRKLPEEARSIDDDERAIALMIAHPSLIKRPVLNTGNGVLVGFKPEHYAAHFGA